MRLSILSIPGIGSQKPGFSKGFEYDVRKYLSDTHLDGNIDFYELTPFSLIGVDTIQEEMFRRIDSSNNLDFRKLRKFALSAFGDAVTFERGASEETSVYKKIHIEIKNKVVEINSNLQDNDLFVIVGCSLGVHLVSTYIYDSDKEIGIFENVAPIPENNLSNLNFLASIGCNLPLFLSGIEKSKIIALDKTKRADRFKWHNYFDRDDILGWPLQQLSPSYENLVEDFEINTGFTPLAHRSYWDDNDFTKPFAETLKTMPF